MGVIIIKLEAYYIGNSRKLSRKLYQGS